MNGRELIREHNNDFPDTPVRTVLDACEGYWMNGNYDDVGGDVESPVGHYYRIEQWIVRTDHLGFREVDEFHTVEIAIKAFNELEEEYSKWGEDETD